jgi:hypothetical protein
MVKFANEGGGRAGSLAAALVAKEQSDSHFSFSPTALHKQDVERQSGRALRTLLAELANVGSPDGWAEGASGGS